MFHVKQTAIGRRIHGRRAVAKGEGTGQIEYRCTHAARSLVHLPARTRRQPRDAPRVLRAGRSWRGQNDATHLSRGLMEHTAGAPGSVLRDAGVLPAEGVSVKDPRVLRGRCSAERWLAGVGRGYPEGRGRGFA